MFNILNKNYKQRHWFKLWLSEGYSIRQLSRQSGYSPEKLRRIIHHWLNQTPSKRLSEISKTGLHIMVDGTYIYKRLVQVVAVLNGTTNTLIKGEYGIKENSESQVMDMMSSLKKQGLILESATVDGNPQMIKVLKTVWPQIIIQRCLVHIQRQGLMWCRQNPKSTAGKELRKLFLKTTCIHSKSERDLFLSETRAWEQKFGCSVASASERGRVASDLKRARSLLIKALPNMFHYLDNPLIPSTSNAIEGYFSRMKSKYRLHHGLSPKRRRAYFNWYFQICFK